MNDAAAPVALSRLVNDVAQETYKDLHATIDTLGDAELDVRRTKMLDYAMRIRHRMVRLLACVQWWGDYSAFHCSATEVRDASVARATDLELAADSLWSCAQVVRGAGARAPFLGPAAQLLGGEALFQCLPQLIENAVGLDLPGLPSVNLESWNENSDAVLRLGTRTRDSVRFALPSGCAVLSWRVAPQDAAVRVGVAGVWDADVVVDRLEADDAVLRVLRVGIHVGSDEDAVGPLRRRSVPGAQTKRLKSNRRSLCSPEEEERFRGMLEDRMYWAGLEDNDALLPASNDTPVGGNPVVPHPGAEQTQPAMMADVLEGHDCAANGGGVGSCCSEGESKHRSRARRMLLSLHNCMSRDVSAAFVMDHVRAQASVLQSHPAWRQSRLSVDGISKSADPWSPVVVKFWAQMMYPSSVTIAPTNFAEGSSMVGVVHAEHDPPVLGVDFPQLCMSRVNVESLLLQSMQLRARELLSSVSSFFEKKSLVESHAHVLDASRRCILLLNLFPKGGVEVSIALPSGALRLRAFGSCAPCGAESSEAESLNCAEDHVFDTVEGIQSHVEKFVRIVKASTVSLVTSRNGCAGDLAVLARCPPGMASTCNKSNLLDSTSLADLAPFTPLERTRASTFLSLRHVDTCPENNTSKGNVLDSPRNGGSCAGEQTSIPERQSVTSGRGLKREATEDGLLFVRGKRLRRSSPQPIGDPFTPRESEIWDGFGQISGVAMAELTSFWANARLQMRRDILLKVFLARGVVESVLEDNIENFGDTVVYRTAVTINANPLPVSTAELRFGRDEEWQLTLTLLTDVWDDATGNAISNRVSFNRSTRELTFKYPAVHIDYIEKCMVDISNAKSLVALTEDLSSLGSEAFQIELQSLHQIRLRFGQYVAQVGCNSKGGHTVKVSPNKAGMPQFARLLEEAVNSNDVLGQSGQSRGKVLGGLLARAGPFAVAIASSVPDNATYCNVFYFMCMRARITIVGKSGAKHILDVDARQREGVMIIDFARALALKSESERVGGRQAGRMKFLPVPKWDTLKKELTSSQRGKEYHSGSALLVPTSTLGALLKVSIDASYRGL